MTTLREALGEDDWAIAAKLVSKLIFVKRNPGEPSTTVLVLVYVDAEGASFEIKIWSTKGNSRLTKIHCVYNKLQVNESYEVQSTPSRGNLFRQTDKEYSTSKWEYSHGGWWIEPIDRVWLGRFLDCSTSLADSLKQLRKRPVNLLATYVSHREGPATHYVDGKPAIQGYVITLVDEDGRRFGALVWHSVRIDRSKFPLFHCVKGDTILVLAARLTGNLSKDPNLKDAIYVTTVNRPVVNSKCVSPDRIGALKRGFRG